jgi:predicted TIM-barrel fold metal-dependent hydrolase
MSPGIGRPTYLDRVALDFPDVSIVGGHIGYAWTGEAIAVATTHEKVFIDTSVYTAERYPVALVESMHGHGRRKVLVGSHYPVISPARALEDLDALSLDAGARRLFVGDSARRVFRIQTRVRSILSERI